MNRVNISSTIAVPDNSQGVYNSNGKQFFFLHKHICTTSTKINSKTLFSEVKGLMSEKIANPSLADRKTSLTNIKVLGDSNQKSTHLSCKKMTASTTRISRGSRTLKRNSLTFNASRNLKKTTVHPNTKRQTMDSKLSKQRSTIVGGGTIQTGSSTIAFAQPKMPSNKKFQCNLCDMSFFYQTSFAAHKKSHTVKNTCEYCDRSFGILAALFKHLRENCAKISIADRKKLLEDDEKSSDLNRTIQKTPTRTPTIKTPKVRGTTDQLLDFVYKSCTPAQVDRLKAMPLKRVPTIKGIRTPRKLINCYSCGEKFKDPVSFATHHAEHCVPNKGGK